MAEQQATQSKPGKTVVWQQFNQTPSDPFSGENPVTRVINMVLNPDKSVRTRGGFRAITHNGLTAPDSSISTYLVESDQPTSLLVAGNSVMWEYDPPENQFLGAGATGPALADVHWRYLTAGEPGYLSSYGGEVYFCQSSGDDHALFAYDGATYRNLGVPGMAGSYDGNAPEVRSGQDFDMGAGADFSNFCGYYVECCDDDAGDVTGCARLPDPFASGSLGQIMFCCAGWGDGTCGNEAMCADGGNCNDPGASCPGQIARIYQCLPQSDFGTGFCWHVPEPAYDGRGEKILNFSFKIGYYDPKRGIFGRAYDSYSVIRFGPNRDEYPIWQYQSVITSPAMATADSKIPDYYSVAVWSSIGQEVLTIKTPHPNMPYMLHGERHAMSDHFNDTMYLEIIPERSDPSSGTLTQTLKVDGCPNDSLCLYKDQTSLVDSGQYTEQYDRPVPSKGMVVLPGGTALYLFPQRIASLNSAAMGKHSTAWTGGEYEILAGDYRPGVEYSVGHPEQIGRWTDKQNETFAALPSLRGEPVYAANDGGAAVLLTRQTMYQLGYSNGSVQVQEMGGPGVLNHKSIHSNSNGLMFVGDEGPVWVRGGRAVEILRELKFDGWMDSLTFEQKSQVRIGMMEDGKKLLMSFPFLAVDGKKRFRTLMHDVSNSFTSEWWIGDNQRYLPDLLQPGSRDQITSMISHKSEDGYKFMLWLERNPQDNPTGGDVDVMYYDSSTDGDGIIGDEETEDDVNGTNAELTDGFGVKSSLEMYVNQAPHLEKEAGALTIDFGHRSEKILVRVSAFESPNDTSDDGTLEAPLEEREAYIYNTEPNLIVLPTFMGMRGKYLRVRIEAGNHPSYEASTMSVKRVTLDVNFDMTPQIRMSPMADTVANQRADVGGLR